MTADELRAGIAAAQNAEAEASTQIQALQTEIAVLQFVRARQSERARVYQELLVDPSLPVTDLTPTDPGLDRTQGDR